MDKLQSLVIIENIQEVINEYFEKYPGYIDFINKYFFEKIPEGDVFARFFVFVGFIELFEKMNDLQIEKNERDLEFESNLYALKQLVRNLYWELIEEIRVEINNTSDFNDTDFYYNEIHDIKDAITDPRFVRSIRSSFAKSILEYVIEEVEDLNKLLENKTNRKDDRIGGKLLEDQIIEYFMQLTELQNDNLPILTKDQVMHFVKANFKAFKERVEIIKFDTPNCSAAYLRRLVYKFHNMHNPTTSTAPAGADLPIRA